MGIQIGRLLIAGVFLVYGTACPAAVPASVEARLAAQNALFEAKYQLDLKNSPETATAYGDYRYNDKLDDNSLAQIERVHAADADFLARLKAISTDGFTEQDAL